MRAVTTDHSYEISSQVELFRHTFNREWPLLVYQLLNGVYSYVEQWRV